MKKIEAFIQHYVLPRVMLSLHELPDFPGLSVLDVLGQGRGRGANGDCLITEQNLPFHRRTLVQVVCDDAAADEIVGRIRAAAHTGKNGDGIIIVTALESSVRIRTGETLASAQP
jgi:nitrogen regulatory protein P-II 1